MVSTTTISKHLINDFFFRICLGNREIFLFPFFSERGIETQEDVLYNAVCGKTRNEVSSPEP